MSGWRWVSRAALELLHDESLAEHGGAPGLRDEGLLESALARLRHLVTYGQPEPDLAELVAAYGIGLACNHPFLDGNKRTAFLAVFLAIGLFLLLNGHRLVATQAEAALTMFAVAAGELDEPALAAWLLEHVQPRL